MPAARAPARAAGAQRSAPPAATARRRVSAAAGAGAQRSARHVTQLGTGGWRSEGSGRSSTGGLHELRGARTGAGWGWAVQSHQAKCARRMHAPGQVWVGKQKEKVGKRTSLCGRSRTARGCRGPSRCLAPRAAPAAAGPPPGHHPGGAARRGTRWMARCRRLRRYGRAAVRISTHERAQTHVPAAGRVRPDGPWRALAPHLRCAEATR